MQNSKETKLYHTVKEASEVTGIPVWKLRDCIKNKILKTYNLLNSRIYLKIEDIESLIEKGGSYDN